MEQDDAPRMPTAIDLFAGTGAVSYALNGICRTLLYCDISGDSRACIRQNIRKGFIDDAPIHDDVCTLMGENVPHADIVTGGFPCVDLSLLGNRRGFDGTHSRLFYEIVRVAQEANAKMIVLENMRGIVTNVKVWRAVLRALHEAGFVGEWMTVAASHLGACHQRSRWFMVAVRCNTEPEWRSDMLNRVQGEVSQVETILRTADKGQWNIWDGHEHSNTGEPMDIPRMQNRKEPNVVTRAQLVGNACVPIQLRSAFILLTHSLLSGRDHMNTQSFGIDSRQRLPLRGQLLSDGSVTELPLPTLKQASFPITLVPSKHKRPGTAKHRVLPALDKPLHLRRWATPRYSMTCSILTKRTQTDLATQMRYAETTPDEQRNLNSCGSYYLEWMQGLPQGFTETKVVGTDTA